MSSNLTNVFLCRSGTHEATVTLTESTYWVNLNDESGSRAVGSYDSAASAIQRAVFCVWGFYLHSMDIR